MRSSSASRVNGSARRRGDKGPPFFATARVIAASSTDVTYGSRPVTPNRQHSVELGQLEPAKSASVSAKSAASAARCSSSKDRRAIAA